MSFVGGLCEVSVCVCVWVDELNSETVVNEPRSTAPETIEFDSSLFSNFFFTVNRTMAAMRFALRL